MIFTVTTLFINKKEKLIVRSQPWGYFFDQQSAAESIINNIEDLFEEGYYNHAVIEKISEGILGSCKKIQWYQAEKIKDKNCLEIKPVSEPSFLKRYVRFWAG